MPTGPLPILLSAKSDAALAEQAARLSAYVSAHPEQPLLDVATTLAHHRAHLEHRLGLLAADRSELAASLAAFADGALPPEVLSATARDTHRVAFVFPGQGAQWAGMGTELLATEPVFAERMRECAAALAEHVEWSLFDVLDDAEALKRDDVVQPASWAVMVSLAALWRSHGVTPTAVLGHSQGEIAAAVVAGALDLADGARAVALRSRGNPRDRRAQRPGVARSGGRADSGVS